MDRAQHLIGEETAMSVANDLKTRVAKVLAEEVAPALRMDGGDVELLEVSDGVAQVRLHGGCGGCPNWKNCAPAGGAARHRANNSAVNVRSIGGANLEVERTVEQA